MTVILYPLNKDNPVVTIKNVQQIETLNGIYVIRTYTTATSNVRKSLRYEVSKYSLTVWNK